MKNKFDGFSKDLNKLAAMVRGKLPKLIREVITNLVTVDVHARDIITVLVENKVSTRWQSQIFRVIRNDHRVLTSFLFEFIFSTSFDWMKALRYYWDDEMDTCLARMSNAEYKYGYEYLGAQRRLVITPLTDKCYLCLMGALQLDLGLHIFFFLV